MVYWHVETDYIALSIYIVLFTKTVLLNRQKDFTDKIFCLALILGILSTVVDIFSSVMMNERMGWWIYEISMIIYGLSVPVLVVVWLLYTVSLVYKGNEKTAKRLISFSACLYAVYAAVIVTNPLHELYFSLSEEIVYARGPWFLPLIVGSQVFFSALGVLMVLVNWKKLHPKSLAFLLLFLYLVTTASYFIQIAFPGWLIICSTFAVAFLVCDATFENERRNALYQKLKQSYDQLQEDKEKELAYQKQLELAVLEANKANQAKSEFLSRMSHDIRTPINGIMGMLGIIRKERHNEERVDDCLNKIERASDHLLSLINDVLDMSKLESAEIVLSQEPFDLRQVKVECLSVLSQTAVDNGITLTWGHGVEDLSHPYLIGSALHLRQILLNIVGNAIKYNKPGGTVHCSFEEIECTGEQAVCRFIVSDTGIGISPEFMPYLFQPFAQEHTGARTHYEGTGLGLSIVKKIVERMDGDISVESEVGVGSIFTITLPFTIDPNPPVAVSEDLSTASSGNLIGTKLLLVEDNDLNLEIAKFLLEDAGILVDVATNGQEALEAFQNSVPGTYNAILMDIMMPVMDGLAATRAIRSLSRPDAGAIPVIAMTANAFAEDVKKCREAGMNAHLAKPIDPTAMFKILAEFIAF